MDILKTVFFVLGISWFNLSYAFIWTNPTKISTFYVCAAGWAYFKPVAAHINPDNCLNNACLALDTTSRNFN